MKNNNGKKVKNFFSKKESVTNGCNGKAVSKRMPAEKHNSLLIGLDIRDMYIESI